MYLTKPVPNLLHHSSFSFQTPLQYSGFLHSGFEMTYLFSSIHDNNLFGHLELSINTSSINITSKAVRLYYQQSPLTILPQSYTLLPGVRTMSSIAFPIFPLFLSEIFLHYLIAFNILACPLCLFPYLPLPKYVSTSTCFYISNVIQQYF